MLAMMLFVSSWLPIESAGGDEMSLWLLCVEFLSFKSEVHNDGGAPL